MHCPISWQDPDQIETPPDLGKVSSSLAILRDYYEAVNISIIGFLPCLHNTLCTSSTHYVYIPMEHWQWPVNIEFPETGQPLWEIEGCAKLLFVDLAPECEVCYGQ